MNLGKWKDFAELFALMAVIASLAAIAFELRQTQTALQAQAYQARAFDGIEINFTLAQSPEFERVTELMGAADFDPSTLSREEHNIAARLITIVRIDLDNEHYQYQRGFLDAGFYLGETARRIKRHAPIWRKLGHTEPRPDFRQEVDRILADPSIGIEE